MSKALQDLREGLYGTGLVQPLDAKSSGGVMSVLCRQVPGQAEGWLKAVDLLLQLGEEKGFDFHLCRRYVRRGGQMVFGWFFGIEAKKAKDLTLVVEEILKVLEKSREFYSAAMPTQSAKQSQPAVQHAPADLSAKTSATRRAPEYTGPDPVAPPGFDSRVRKFRTADGGEVMVMPVPHAYGDHNKPKNNRGAATLGSNAQLFQGLKTSGGGAV